MKNKPVAIKKTDLFTFYPNIGVDTLNGKPISNGYMHMSYQICSVQLKHNGKKFEVEVIGGGGVKLRAINGRSCAVNIEKIINLAVDAGLLDEKIDFTETEQA